MRSLLPTARPFRRLATLALIVLFTGCLTIEENYTFKKDGSGTMEYVIDLSAMAEFMKSMGDGKAKEESGMDGMRMNGKADQLKAVPGVKKVKLKTEADGYLQRISFDFKDITALNAALNVLMPDSTGRQQEFFHWEGNTLVRANNAHAMDIGNDMGDDGNGTDSLSVILQSMQYKYSFAFAKEVAGTEQAEGMVKETPDAKKVKLSTDWSVIMKDPKALDLRITLNK
ncbi:MAG: hypothetical protein QM724_11525 [Flavobacteriales bacterium]